MIEVVRIQAWNNRAEPAATGAMVFGRSRRFKLLYVIRLERYQSLDGPTDSAEAALSWCPLLHAGYGE